MRIVGFVLYCLLMLFALYLTRTTLPVVMYPVIVPALLVGAAALLQARRAESTR